MTDVTNLPEIFDFDLDSWEPEAKDVKEPYRVKVEGRVISFSDPRDEDWRDLLNLQSPVQFIRVCCSEEDRKFLYENPMKSRKLERLMKGFMDHFDVEEAIAEAQRTERLRGL